MYLPSGEKQTEETDREWSENDFTGSIASK
jgi:hypothetical protein